ncbi:hypothetical protein Mapa_018661 [Marchantia paleacea]|nr:hypothetical protein Mapa_018661 [Marchantia paleacea]
MNPSSRKLQESATAMLKNMTPLLQKCRSMSFRKMLMPNAAAVNRSSQLTELIKWQQEMFHRILNMMCLVEEGLTEQAELDAFRADLLQTLTTAHPNGEWADFTRDKLLYLQDLFQSKCISEEEYHKAKRPILSRLADQGAELDSQDFKFNSKAIRHTGESSSKAEMDPTRNVAEVAQAPEAESPCDVPANSGSAKKTPIKHVMEAMARLKTVGVGKNVHQAQQAVRRSPGFLTLWISFVATPATALLVTLPSPRRSRRISLWTRLCTSMPAPGPPEISSPSCPTMHPNLKM